MKICQCGKTIVNPRSKQCRECYQKKMHNYPCKGCGRVLPIEAYYWKHTQNRRRSRCKECEAKERREHQKLYPEIYREQARKFRKNNPEKSKRWAQRTSWRKLGLDPDFVEQYANSHTQCEICGKTDYRSLCADHCHKTNKLRGMLCSACNSGLGHFGDNSDLLIKAIEYLKTHS